MTKAGDRLSLGKAGVKIEDRDKGGEEVQLLVLTTVKNTYKFTKNVTKRVDGLDLLLFPMR